MTIKVHIPTPLRRYSDNASSVDVEGSTLDAIFEGVFEQYPGLRIRVINDRGEIHPYLILLIGSEEIPRDHWRHRTVGDGDEVDIVPAVEGGSDVRMRGFKDRATVERALAYAMEDLGKAVQSVTWDKLHGRVLAEDVTSAVNVPSFDRSAMDGYAVVAETTFGATAYNPLELKIVGESMPGSESRPSVARGEACRIMTGAPMPAGADAVVMAEDCEAEGDRLQVRDGVTPGKNVGRTGEDIQEGEVVLRAGRQLRPQDVGLLVSIGHARASCVMAPTVETLVTGNELLAPGAIPGAGKIVDSNSPMMAALVARDGGALVEQHRLADDANTIREFLAQTTCDVLLCAGGSSVGREDYLPLLLAELGELPIHGIAMRPSAPTGIGRIGKTRVFLLPGNPVSCLCAYDHFASPVIRTLAGMTGVAPYPRREMILARRISSVVGRHDYVRVSLESDGRISPITLSGASLLSSTTRAVGFVLIEQDSEGVAEGETVTVHFYDQSLGIES